MRSASWSSTAGSVGAAALSCDHTFSSTSSTEKSAEEVGVWLRDVGGLLACRDGGVSLRDDASSPDERSTTSPPSLSASGLARRSSALGGPLEGWWVASKGLGPLPRKRGSALAHGCGRSGNGALPLPRAAAVSTRLRVPAEAEDGHRVSERLRAR